MGPVIFLCETNGSIESYHSQKSLFSLLASVLVGKACQMEMALGK